MKNFFELSLEEKRKVYENNSKLQEIVTSHMIECEEDYANEIFSYVSEFVKSYCISYCGCYANVITDVYGFLNGVNEIQNTFEFFGYAEYEDIEKLTKTAQRFADGHYREGIFDDFFSEQAENILDDIIRKIRRMFDWTSKDEEEYFLDCCDDIFFDEDGEYLVDDDYILYNVKTVKTCYK